jgi:hypothetical protein
MTDTTKTTVTLDNLFAGDFPVAKDYVTIADSQTLTRGAVLGIITANGQAKLLDTASVDGSQNFYAVLLKDVTTSGATKGAPVALTGDFNAAALSLGGATVAADVKSDMRALSCFQRTLDALV